MKTELHLERLVPQSKTMNVNRTFAECTKLKKKKKKNSLYPEAATITQLAVHRAEVHGTCSSAEPPLPCDPT